MIARMPLLFLSSGFRLTAVGLLSFNKNILVSTLQLLQRCPSERRKQFPKSKFDQRMSDDLWIPEHPSSRHNWHYRVSDLRLHDGPVSVQDGQRNGSIARLKMNKAWCISTVTSSDGWLIWRLRSRFSPSNQQIIFSQSHIRVAWTCTSSKKYMSVPFPRHH